MLRLRGRGLGGGMAIGTAAVMRTARSIPVAPERVAAEQARTPRDVPIELADVVLVSPDYDAARSMALPWARTVAIVSETAVSGSCYDGVPTVVDVPALLESVQDDMLLLVDGDRGVVLVDPDGHALASYQAERDRVAPRRRVHIDFGHEPARTLDSRLVRVMAAVRSQDDVRAAIREGADALYVPAKTALVADDASDEEQLDLLIALAELAQGKPVTVAGDAATLSAEALLRAALRADLTLAVPLAGCREGITEVRAWLTETGEDLLARDEDYGQLRLAATASPESLAVAIFGDDDLADVERVIVEVGVDALTPHDAAWVAGLFARLTQQLTPLEIVLPEDVERWLAPALGLGASGVIVPPDAVQSTKASVRALDGLACAEAAQALTAEG